MAARSSPKKWYYACVALMAGSWMVSFVMFVNIIDGTIVGKVADRPIKAPYADGSPEARILTKPIKAVDRDIKGMLQTIIDKTERKRFTKGMTRWEIHHGLDVVGSDLEVVGGKEKAISACFYNPACKGFVWSESQDQAYLKTNVDERKKRKPGLKLSLYTRGYQEQIGFIIGESEKNVGERQVDTVDDAKLACEGMRDCGGFVIFTGSSPHASLKVKFYTSAAMRSKFHSAESASILYQISDLALVSGEVSKAEVLGISTNEIPEDISSNPPIIVGGTDGSGTRAVVTLLSNLNVLMVKDDECTFDVHAGEMGGWPPPVRLALKHSHSADYDPLSIPEADRTQIRIRLKKFADKMIREAKRLSKIHRHERWGFKAPISQMLLPFLNEIFPGFSFVHVIRDGRDVAFSKNQSPVAKFFGTMYSNDESALQLPDRIKAIRMWSDANIQVRQYMKRNPTQPYFPLHIETSVEEASLLRIGANANQMLKLGFKHEDMCCRLGSYIRLLKDKDFFKGIKSRYGKWRKLTENDLNLRSQLNKYGKKGLVEFDYFEERDGKPMAFGVNDGTDVCSDVVIDDKECKFEFPSKCVH